MENLEWLNGVKKADGDIDEIVRKMEGKLDSKLMTNIRIDYRKIKALEIIAETLIDINNNLSAIINYDGDSISVVARINK